MAWDVALFVGVCDTNTQLLSHLLWRVAQGSATCGHGQHVCKIVYESVYGGGIMLVVCAPGLWVCAVHRQTVLHDFNPYTWSLDLALAGLLAATLATHSTTALLFPCVLCKCGQFFWVEPPRSHRTEGLPEQPYLPNTGLQKRPCRMLCTGCIV